MLNQFLIGFYKVEHGIPILTTTVLITTALGSAIIIACLDGMPFGRRAKLWWSGGYSLWYLLWWIAFELEVGQGSIKWAKGTYIGVDLSFRDRCASALFSAGVFYAAQFWKSLTSDHLSMIRGVRPKVRWVDD